MIVVVVVALREADEIITVGIALAVLNKMFRRLRIPTQGVAIRANRPRLESSLSSRLH